MRRGGKVAATVSAAAIALSLGLIRPWEGRELTPYYDIVGVLTWCDGETRGTPKARYTEAECDAITAKAVIEFATAIAPCLPPVLPDPTRAAFISAAYNIGSGAFCKSTMSRRAKAGDIRGACEALTMWNKAGGRVVRGLTNRRAAERKLCLSGLAP